MKRVMVSALAFALLTLVTVAPPAQAASTSKA